MDAFSLPLDLSDLQSRIHPLLRAVSSAPLLHILKPSSTADSLAVVLSLLTSFGYLTRGRLWDKPDRHYHVYFQRPQELEGGAGQSPIANRDVAQCLHDGDYDCVIFWGSQSGTSERFAQTLGHEALSRFGVKALVADLSDYDAESIARIPATRFAVFILSTYGEGDPSDNTAGLWDWIKHDINVDGLRYISLGLGNSNYKYYNRVLDVIADALDRAGATALIPRQKADDAKGGTEEDFQAWKDDVFAFFRDLGYEEKAVAYQPSMSVNFGEEPFSTETSGSMTSLHHQRSSTNSAIVPLAIKNVRELFTAGDRNCVHMELDLGSSDLVYKTGDHIGIWPCNPDEEVDRLLRVLGLERRKSEHLIVTPIGNAIHVKIHSPTTPETVFRNHLEICSPVARNLVIDIAHFAPSPAAKTALLDIARDRKRYEQFATANHITLARLLEYASPGQAWSSIPLSMVFEGLHLLQPRYYSISSSSVISPRRIAITALVVNQEIKDGNQTVDTISGLTSNYILSASSLPSRSNVPTPTYTRATKTGSPQNTKILAHLRRTKFKLPITASTPLILVAAGTGLAPFRAFLQERTKLHALGKPVGKMLLFFGCRNQDDFIYSDEIEKMQEQLGDKLKVITAFSRSQGHQRLYVQDRLAEHTAEVLELLDFGANMYVCGKASMAREVDRKLEDAVLTHKGLEEREVKAWVDGLKKRGKWRADVWG